MTGCGYHRKRLQYNNIVQPHLYINSIPGIMGTKEATLIPIVVRSMELEAIICNRAFPIIDHMHDPLHVVLGIPVWVTLTPTSIIGCGTTYYRLHLPHDEITNLITKQTQLCYYNHISHK